MQTSIFFFFLATVCLSQLLPKYHKYLPNPFRPETITNKVILELQSWTSLGQPGYNPTAASTIGFDLQNFYSFLNSYWIHKVRNNICVQRLRLSPAESLLSYLVPWFPTFKTVTIITSYLEKIRYGSGPYYLKVFYDISVSISQTKFSLVDARQHQTHYIQPCWFKRNWSRVKSDLSYRTT